MHLVGGTLSSLIRFKCKYSPSFMFACFIVRLRVDGNDWRVAVLGHSQGYSDSRPKRMWNRGIKLRDQWLLGPPTSDALAPDQCESLSFRFVFGQWGNYLALLQHFFLHLMYVFSYICFYGMSYSECMFYVCYHAMSNSKTKGKCPHCGQ